MVEMIEMDEMNSGSGEMVEMFQEVDSLIVRCAFVTRSPDFGDGSVVWVPLWPMFFSVVPKHIETGN